MKPEINISMYFIHEKQNQNKTKEIAKLSGKNISKFSM